MNSTSTERQRRYRKRRIESGDIRLHIWVNADCKAAIDRLARRMKLHPKQVIEKLISIADNTFSTAPSDTTMTSQ